MHKDVALPDRCIVCNQAAESRRIKRTLYWTPRGWRYTAAALLAGGYVLGAWLNEFGVFGGMLLLVLLLHLAQRKSLKIELGVCAPHRRRRNVLQALSVACIVVLVGCFFIIRESNFNFVIALMMSSAIALLALGLLQSLVGIQAVRLSDFAEEHVWLSGTGAAFRETLPELH